MSLVPGVDYACIREKKKSISPDDSFTIMGRRNPSVDLDEISPLGDIDDVSNYF
jgi:hypothetical protein